MEHTLEFPIIILTREEVGGYANDYRLRGGSKQDAERYLGATVFDSSERNYTITNIQNTECWEPWLNRILSPVPSTWKYKWGVGLNEESSIERFVDARDRIIDVVNDSGWVCVSERQRGDGRRLTCVTEFTKNEVRNHLPRLKSCTSIAEIALYLTNPLASQEPNP